MCLQHKNHFPFLSVSVYRSLISCSVGDMYVQLVQSLLTDSCSDEVVSCLHYLLPNYKLRSLFEKGRVCIECFLSLYCNHLHQVIKSHVSHVNDNLDRQIISFLISDIIHMVVIASTYTIF